MIDARALAATIRAHPGVARLHPGPLGTASTFTADGRVWGIRIGPDTIDIHVIVRPGFAIIQLARALAEAVTAQIGTPEYAGTVRVHVEDLLVDETVATLAEIRAAPRRPDAAADPPPYRVPPAPDLRRNQ